jgi:hypothetical protein
MDEGANEGHPDGWIVPLGEKLPLTAVKGSRIV